MRRPLAIALLAGCIAAAASGAGALLAARPASSASAIDARIDADFRAGVRQLGARDFDAAARSMQSVLRSAPALPEAHVNLGYALLGLGHASAARRSFETAIELRAGQANAWYGLAMVHETDGNLRAARQAMRVFVHLAGPDHPHVRKARAALWEWQASLADPLAARSP